MKIIKLLNYLLVVIAIIGGLLQGVETLLANNVYDSLINLSIIPVMLLPIVLHKWFNMKINPMIETIYFIFVFFSHFLGSIINLYNIIDYYDAIMHWLSGIMSSFVAIIILISFKEYHPKKVWFNIIFILIASLAVAGLWEFIEYSCDHLFNKDAQLVLTTGVNDTMQDMLAALIGSILFCIMYGYEEITKTKLFIKYFIKELNGSER